MTTSHYILIAGLSLGAVQLSVGVAIGLWIGRRRMRAALADTQQEVEADRERALRLASDLQGLTASVADSVRRHGEAIEAVDDRLRTESERLATEAQSNGDTPPDESPLTRLVVGVVGEMLAANQQLRKELTEAESTLERQADELVEQRKQTLTDPLTGLQNRRALDDLLRAHLDAWRKHGSPFSLLMLDIDHFKKFNDQHGHPAGDAALKSFGGALTAALRKQDVVTRYGGEEFAVLLPSTTLSEAFAAVAKVREAIRQLRVEVKGQELAITASGGLATINGQESADSTLNRADDALYSAKEAGRDQVHLHDGDSIRPVDGQGPGDGGAAIADPLSEEVREACSGLRASLDNFLDEPSFTGPV